MKHAVRALVLGAILVGNANAAVQDTAGQPALNKSQTAKAASPALTKHKALRTRKAKPKGALVDNAAAPKATIKLDNMTEKAPPESNDDSVQIKGVRG